MSEDDGLIEHPGTGALCCMVCGESAPGNEGWDWCDHTTGIGCEWAPQEYDDDGGDWDDDDDIDYWCWWCPECGEPEYNPSPDCRLCHLRQDTIRFAALDVLYADVLPAATLVMLQIAPGVGSWIPF